MYLVLCISLSLTQLADNFKWNVSIWQDSSRYNAREWCGYDCCFHWTIYLEAECDRTLIRKRLVVTDLAPLRPISNITLDIFLFSKPFPSGHRGRIDAVVAVHLPTLSAHVTSPRQQRNFSVALPHSLRQGDTCKDLFVCDWYSLVKYRDDLLWNRDRNNSAAPLGVCVTSISMRLFFKNEKKVIGEWCRSVAPPFRKLPDRTRVSLHPQID